jgi:hypothetical protein
VRSKDNVQFFLKDNHDQLTIPCQYVKNGRINIFWPEHDMEVWIVMHAQVIDDISKSIQSYELFGFYGEIFLNYCDSMFININNFQEIFGLSCLILTINGF